MAEYQVRQPGPDGYALDPARIRYDLYRLLASIYGSDRFPHDGLDFENPSSLAHLAGEFEADELNHLLLTIAISVRAAIERWQRKEGARPIADLVCGELRHSRGEEPLGLREACNKVIHADRLNLDVDRQGDRIVRTNPIFYLYGSNRGEEWKARLDLEKFATVCLGL